MKMKKLLLLPALLLTLSVGNVACSYHNDDNPNEYPDPQPEPEPEPEPGPDINQKYLEAAYTSNCFMVKPGQSVDIPILKAFAMWNLYAEWLGETDLMGLTPEPVLLWQDLPGLITNVGLIPGQQAEEGSIAVSTADKVGNAVIGICIFPCFFYMKCMSVVKRIVFGDNSCCFHVCLLFGRFFCLFFC